MTTKKKAAPKKHLKSRRFTPPNRKAPKSLFAAVDPQGRVRFTHDSEVAVEGWVGKLKKFYSMATYDLRVSNKEKRK